MTKHIVWMPVEWDKPVITVDKGDWSGLLTLPHTITAFEDISDQDGSDHISVEIDESKHSLCEAREVEIGEDTSWTDLMAVALDLNHRIENLNNYIIAESEELSNERKRRVALETELFSITRQAVYWQNMYNRLKKVVINEQGHA